MTWMWPDKSRINARRIELGLSQNALSKRARVGKTTIERLLGKSHRRATYNTFKRIADALELSVNEITVSIQPNKKSVKDSEPKPCHGICHDSSTGLPQGLSEYLIGRDNELNLLNQTWADPTANIISIVGIGGNGKTTLINHWLETFQPMHQGAQTIFTWSFSGQGGPQPVATVEGFFNKAWRWFCPELIIPSRSIQRALTLADRIASNCHLLILDGLEVLQMPPGDKAGLLPPDGPMLTFLNRLSQHNQGLCIITSRIQLEDFNSKRKSSVPQLDLPALSTANGSTLLRRLGVNGQESELASAVDNLWGHPLSLVILARYLTQLDPLGRIERWSCDNMPSADSRANNQAENIIAQYEAWLDDTAKLSVLRILSLFDYSIDLTVIEIFRQQPEIAGLSDKLSDLNDDEWMVLLSDLAKTGLINFVQTQSELGLELHPVVRRYFYQRLKRGSPKAWLDGHARLYFYELANCTKSPSSFDELIPLFRLVRFGCEAGLHEQVFNEVVWERILQGFPALSIHKFNVEETEMIAVSWFFQNGDVHPDKLLIKNSNSTTQGRLLWWAGLVYRLSGRLSIAIQLFTRAEQEFHRRNDIVGKAATIAYISRCQFSNGHLSDALISARRAVDVVESDLDYFADRFLETRSISPVLRTAMKLASKVQVGRVPIFQRLVLFPLADALHHSGQLYKALEIFEFGYQSRLPLVLSSWDVFVGQDSMYYDLLLTLGKLDQVRHYASNRLKTLSTSPMLSSLMHTVLLQAETKELDNPYRIPQLETEFKRYGETLDFRVNYHYVRGLLELAAASRSLGEYNQARRIISAANSLRESLNIDLLKADVLIEQANLAFAMGDAHLALAEVTQAQNLMNENGYGLHKQAVKELLDRVQVSHDPGAVNTIE